MNSAFYLINKFQTASPFELAKQLGVEVIFKELPKGVFGTYVPIQDKRFILVNKAASEISHRFTCAYHLGLHLVKDNGVSFQMIKSYSDYNPYAVMFGADLLEEYGEYRNTTMVDHYLANGTPPHIVLGVGKQYDKAKALCNYPSFPILGFNSGKP